MKAGWQPRRSIITLAYRLRLFTEGYSWFPAVEQFLQEFGGLQIKFPTEHGSDTLHFNASQAASGVYSDWALNNYAQRIGNGKLSVIGQAYSDHMTLYMTNTGEVYGGFDDFLCFIAESGKAAIEVICQGLPIQEIPELP